jgi:hypothetical protein
MCEHRSGVNGRVCGISRQPTTPTVGVDGNRHARFARVAGGRAPQSSDHNGRRGTGGKELITHGGEAIRRSDISTERICGVTKATQTQFIDGS